MTRDMGQVKLSSDLIRWLAFEAPTIDESASMDDRIYLMTEFVASPSFQAVLSGERDAALGAQGDALGSGGAG